MNYQIGSEWESLSAISGIGTGIPVILRNCGRAGDLIEIIISDTSPSPADRGDILNQINDSYRISGQTANIWLRYIRYDYAGSVIPEGARKCLFSVSTVNNLVQNSAIPQDIISDADYSLRRLNTSAQDSSATATLEGKRHVISAVYEVQAGNSMALNVSPASNIMITKVSTNNGLEVSLRAEYATGLADGIFSAINTDLSSIDHSPTNGQVFYAAINTSSPLFISTGFIVPMVKAVQGSTPCVMVKNSTGAARDINIIFEFEEIGERSPSFGLTAITQLTATTDMTQYG